MEEALKVIIPILATVIFGIITYLLSKVDKGQEQQIKDIKEQLDKQRGINELLFKKHDLDAEALNKLELSIAREHYLKHELDGRFLSLETTFKDGMSALSQDVKNLTQVMLAHLEKDRAK